MRPLILVRYRGPNENSVLVLRVTQLLSSLPPLPGGGRPCLLNYELAILTSGSWVPHPAERQRAGYQGRSPWLVVALTSHHRNRAVCVYAGVLQAIIHDYARIRAPARAWRRASLEGTEKSAPGREGEAAQQAAIWL